MSRLWPVKRVESLARRPVVEVLDLDGQIEETRLELGRLRAAEGAALDAYHAQAARWWGLGILVSGRPWRRYVRAHRAAQAAAERHLVLLGRRIVSARSEALALIFGPRREGPKTPSGAT